MILEFQGVEQMLVLDVTSSITRAQRVSLHRILAANGNVLQVDGTSWDLVSCSDRSVVLGETTDECTEETRADALFDT